MIACEPEFLRALVIGLMLGFSCGFVCCAVLTLGRDEENRP